MRLIPYALSDVGRKRQHNEDSFLIAPSVGLFAVADGMGGHRAGEKASRMAVERLRDALVPPRKGATRDEVLGHLQRAMFVTGAAIFDAAQSDPDLAGMGTTLTSILFHGVRAYVAHVGDSRAYLYRDGGCRRSRSITRGSPSRSRRAAHRAGSQGVAVSPHHHPLGRL